MLRDKHTGKHKGFAYVEMKDLETIENCLLFNNVVPNFQKFPILVKASEAEKNFLANKEKIAQKDGSADKDNKVDGRVYIGSLHPSITQEQLQVVFSDIGHVEYVNLHRDDKGNSKGYAFARFTDPSNAAIAIEKLNGLEIGGRNIKVATVKDSSSTKNEVSVAALNIPGPSLGLSISGQQMGQQNSFEQGNQQAGASNWKLDDDEGAGISINSQSRAALMAKLGGRAGMDVPIPTVPTVPSVNTTPGVPTISGTPSRCFVIRNMFDLEEERANGDGWDLDIKEDVSEECGKHGNVEFCYVESKKPGGLVFLKFASSDAAVKAAMSLNGRYFAGRMITVAYIDIPAFDTMFS